MNLWLVCVSLCTTYAHLLVSMQAYTFSFFNFFEGKERELILFFVFFKNKFIYLFIFGCIGSSFLRLDFL